MSVLDEASVDERKRLLELFPVALLRKVFEFTGTKDEVALQLSNDQSADQIQRIRKFVEDHVGCCRQHVYVFPDAAIPGNTNEVEVVAATNSTGLFLARAKYTVIIQEPLQKEDISYLWPILVHRVEGNLVVRFVVLEKDLSSIFGDQARLADRQVTEEKILEAWGLPIDLRIDLNKGIKKLWDEDWIDCFRGKYKKAYSISIETMDGDRSIKKQYETIYALMMTSPIHTSIFKLMDNGLKLKSFSCNPTEGTIGFPTYSHPGDSDAVIQKILESNQ